eukprot:3302439-Prymnesium_polylepis.1
MVGQSGSTGLTFRSKLLLAVDYGVRSVRAVRPCSTQRCWTVAGCACSLFRGRSAGKGTGFGRA